MTTFKVILFTDQVLRIGLTAKRFSTFGETSNGISLTLKYKYSGYKIGNFIIEDTDYLLGIKFLIYITQHQFI